MPTPTPSEGRDPVAGPSELHRYQADLHIHTCLSPCSDWGMGPKGIVSACQEKDIHLIAVCDHNSAENAGAVITAGNRVGITVFPGMEVCSKEEVHLLTIFETQDQTLDMQQLVYDHLPGENKSDLFGYQVVANSQDEVTGENPHLLIGATRLGLNQIVHETHRRGGVCIASHIDRPAYGLIGQLGFIPPDLDLDGFEVSYHTSISTVRQTTPGLGNRPCITSSDAHYPKDIGRAATVLLMAAPTFKEFHLALLGRDGRTIDSR